MTLQEVAIALDTPVESMPDLEFLSITEDSRRVSPGALFVAVAGGRVDGHDFVERARAAGAVAIVGEREASSGQGGVPYIHVPHARAALGRVAHRLRGDPSQAMTVVGVTGTNGKSTVVHLIGELLRGAGHTVGQFGTLGYRIAGKSANAPHTTPFGEELARLFGEARDAGCTHIAMEVSSHALAQDRVAGIAFDGAVFTNLTQDHLDYHADLEEYFEEKMKLIEGVAGDDPFVVVNCDDSWGRRAAERASVETYTFGETGDCRAENATIAHDGISFRFLSPWGSAEVTTPLMGRHNLSNILAAASVCGRLGVAVEAMAESLRTIEAAPGRFELIDEGQDFRLIVDYAHTEDGLRNVLSAARGICSGRILTVFGCGGDRDRAKRPAMAAAVAELSDFGIVTSDNPRTEDPDRILLDMEVGFQRSGKKKGTDYRVIPDRAEAIEAAVNMARPGDLVMIAGKGHEDYQIFGSGRIRFDDREVARTALEALAR